MPKFGWNKDKRDDRDRLRGKALYGLPSVVDLSMLLPSVRDQGNLGSCTGFGIGGNLTGCAIQQDAYTEWFSPTWIYNGARLLEGTLLYDDGAYPRDCLEFIREYGCLLEHFRPYTDKLDKSDPTQWPVAPEALKWPIVSYTRCVDGIDGIKSALAAGHLVSIGSPWYSSWMYPDANGNCPDSYDFVAGGHEYLCYGYDSGRKILLCQNSWGKSWGNGGRFTIPFSAIDEFKFDGGYDAHYVNVDWGDVEPEPPEPEPPDPVVKKTNWLLIAIIAAVVVAAIVLIFK
jgi:C1A family cysteine protease